MTARWAAGARRNWSTNNASANVTIKGALPRLRARSRDHVRNTWWGARVKTVFGSHAVGAGVTPVSKTGNKKLDKIVAEAWRAWGAACDAEGQLDINGLINLAVGCTIESGEVLARMDVVPDRPDLKVPLELALLEPDHLDASRDQFGPDKFVYDGIEYNRRAKRAAYWLFPVHPAERGIVVRSIGPRAGRGHAAHVPQGSHRPGARRAVARAGDPERPRRADLEEAIVVKGRIEACLAAFIKTNNAGSTLASKVEMERGEKGEQRRIETLSPGMVDLSRTGRGVANRRAVVVAAIRVRAFNQLAGARAGAGITYDQLTGDLRRANFSSLRAGKIEFRRVVEQFQWLTLVRCFSIRCGAAGPRSRADFARCRAAPAAIRSSGSCRLSSRSIRLRTWKRT
jgi:lambda family phage portal protein